MSVAFSEHNKSWAHTDTSNSDLAIESCLGFFLHLWFYTFLFLFTLKNLVPINTVTYILFSRCTKNSFRLGKSLLLLTIKIQDEVSIFFAVLSILGINLIANYVTTKVLLIWDLGRLPRNWVCWNLCFVSQIHPRTSDGTEKPFPVFEFFFSPFLLFLLHVCS